MYDNVSFVFSHPPEDVIDIISNSKYIPGKLFLAVVLSCVLRLGVCAGADPSARTSRGHQALHLAAENGHTETVRMLLDSGADLNAKDEVGSIRACQHRHTSGRS